MNYENRMYVLRSVCETVTKFGVSMTYNKRINGIIKLEGLDFKLLYLSHGLDRYEGEKVERLLTEHYKDDIIKGKEWVTTSPIKIINFIINELGIKQKEYLNIEVNNKYPMWIAKSNDYFKAEIVRENSVRENQRGECFVRFVNNMQFVTLGFCNSGDADKLARQNPHLVNSAEYTTKLLHNKTYKEWLEAVRESKTPLNYKLNNPLKPN